MSTSEATDSTLDPLVRDLVEWVAREPRTYRDVMDAWRTSCPRLTVWEEAEERGLLTRDQQPGHGLMIRVTPAGRAILAQPTIRPQTRAP